MPRPHTWLSLLAFGAALACTAPALAQDQAPGDTQRMTTAGLTPQEITDQTKVTTALHDFTKGGYTALATHLDELRDVMNHAPTRFPKIEVRGAITLIRADSPEFDRLSADAKAESPTTTVVKAFNTYPWASFMLGSYANEQKHFDEAIGYLEHGLVMQPEHDNLLGEKGFALAQTHRPAEALAAYQAALKAPVLVDRRRAVLLRGVGFAYIDLQRLDDAQAAYEDSLKFDATNQIAKNELKYIAEHRSSAAP